MFSGKGQNTHDGPSRDCGPGNSISRTKIENRSVKNTDFIFWLYSESVGPGSNVISSGYVCGIPGCLAGVLGSQRSLILLSSAPPALGSPRLEGGTYTGGNAQLPPPLVWPSLLARTFSLPSEASNTVLRQQAEPGPPPRSASPTACAK